MSAPQMPGDVASWLKHHGIERVRTEGVNHDGVVVGKVFSAERFVAAAERGAPFSDLLYGADVVGAPYLGWWDEWRHPGIGDLLQRPDPATLVPHPTRPDLACCIADHTDVEGEPLPVCVRSMVRRLAAELAQRGFEARMSMEVEAIAFAEPFAEARKRKFRNLTPLGGGGHLYSIAAEYEIDELVSEIARRCAGAGVPIEAASQEVAHGQIELNIPPSDPVTAADRIVRLRLMAREAALDLGCSLTFMPKPSGDQAYSSGAHVHHSLWRDGEPAGSDVTRHWLGGLMSTLPAVVSMLCPTINAYRRFREFTAAPTTVTWDEDNRSTALRVVGRPGSDARIEHRLPSADVNPYLAMAVIIAGGLAGLDGQLEPPDRFPYLAWGVPAHVPRLPTTISTAADALEADCALEKHLGDDFVSFWVNTRRWEWLQFHTGGGDASAATTTDWELQRYFELG